jgi:hypothetical protein
MKTWLKQTALQLLSLQRDIKTANTAEHLNSILKSVPNCFNMTTVLNNYFNNGGSLLLSYDEGFTKLGCKMSMCKRDAKNSLHEIRLMFSPLMNYYKDKYMCTINALIVVCLFYIFYISDSYFYKSQRNSNQNEIQKVVVCK